MERLLSKLVEWLEYFKKKDAINDKRFNNIEDFLSKSSDENIELLIKRLEKLEEEVLEDDNTTNTDDDGIIE